MEQRLASSLPPSLGAKRNISRPLAGLGLALFALLPDPSSLLKSLGATASSGEKSSSLTGNWELPRDRLAQGWKGLVVTGAARDL